MLSYSKGRKIILALLIIAAIEFLLFSVQSYARYRNHSMQGRSTSKRGFNKPIKVSSILAHTMSASDGVTSHALPSNSIIKTIAVIHPSATLVMDTPATRKLNKSIGVTVALTQQASYHGNYVPTESIPDTKPIPSTRQKSDVVGKCNEAKRKAVIIHAPTRSGSTFLGEFFNQHSEVYYLFEPLYAVPFDRSDIRLNAMKDLFLCDYSRIPKLYESTPNDRWSQCRSNLCFSSKSKFLWRNTKFCVQDPPTCGVRRFDPQSLENVCRQSLFTAMKVVRLQSLSELVPLLSDPRLDLRVIQLVRDPRAVVPSEIKMLGIDKKATPRIAKYLCSRYHKDWMYHQYCILGLNISEPFHIDPMYCNETTKNLWKGKFIRLSHEFVSEDPMRAMTIIYEFTELNFDKSVAEWLKSNTNIKSKQHSGSRNAKLRQEFYGTARHSRNLLKKWRLSQPLANVKETQAQCIEAMQKLGYLSVTTTDSLLNITTNLYSNDKAVYVPDILKNT